MGRHRAAAVAAAPGEASEERAPRLPPERNLLDVLTHSTKWSRRTSRRSGGGALLSQNTPGGFLRGWGQSPIPLPEKCPSHPK